jgi:hypothetical protein
MLRMSRGVGWPLGGINAYLAPRITTVVSSMVSELAATKLHCRNLHHLTLVACRASCNMLQQQQRRNKHDWMRDAEREARSRLPSKGKDGGVQAHLIDALQFEIKDEMMAQTVRLQDRLNALIEKLAPLRLQAEEDASLVKRFNLERSTALRLLHEYSVQREAATGQAITPEMTSAFKIPRGL